MKKNIAIIGGGASALMLATQLDSRKFDITVFERNHALGRKFLVAGDGGFNLTHSEPSDQLIGRYTPSDFFRSAVNCFNNEDLRIWLKKIGIETFVGTSKRVFPIKGVKPIAVLNCFLDQLIKNNVHIKNQYEWQGWNDKNELVFEHLQQRIIVNPDIIVFAMGGSSWKVTGSDGTWLPYFKGKNISTFPFQPSNCAYQVHWERTFIDAFEGTSLKNCTLKCGDLEKKGEVVITRFGLEGSAIYALSPEIRKLLMQHQTASVFIDLKPSLSTEHILQTVKYKGNRSLGKQLQNELNINDVQLALLKSLLSKEEFTDPLQLALKLKHLPVHITGWAPIDEAISTVGGIDLNEVTEYYELKKMPGHFVIGEMLDWDAPTGGYLLQACFSMGYFLAKHLNNTVV